MHVYHHVPKTAGGDGDWSQCSQCNAELLVSYFDAFVLSGRPAPIMPA